MIKNLIKGLAVGTLLLAAVPAFAASISDARFSNNQTSIDATGGATVSGTFTLTVGSGEVVEWFRLLPSGNPFTETSVGGQLGYQEGVYTNVPFNVKVPPNTGTYNVDVQGAGIWGGNRSINGGDNVVLGATSVGAVRVVANSVDSSVPTTGGSDVDFWTKLATVLAGILKPATPAPTTNAACTTLAVKSAGAIMGTTGQANVKLQGFLLSEGASIPALAAGAAFGYYGNQTAAAVAWFKSVNGCI